MLGGKIFGGFFTGEAACDDSVYGEKIPSVHWPSRRVIHSCNQWSAIYSGSNRDGEPSESRRAAVADLPGECIIQKLLRKNFVCYFFFLSFLFFFFQPSQSAFPRRKIPFETLSKLAFISNILSPLALRLIPRLNMTSAAISVPSATDSAPLPKTSSPTPLDASLPTPISADFGTNPLATRYAKPAGRELFESIGRPKTVVAPMVDQSELAWRILSRRYGADLCYTPMYHARLFATSEQYRNDMFGEADGDATTDRPLVVQFCANKPEELLAAARLVEDRCDAVDLNLGCPQGIARKGHYGSFLMEEWDLIYQLINTLHKELKIPVTAKIRVFDDREKTLAYAKHVLAAGAQFLTVHGRTREMKGQKTGLADWSIIRYLRDNLPPNTVMIANGNLLYQEDIDRSLYANNVDAVMSAEGNLYNPAIFNTVHHKVDEKFPRVDKLLREYFEIVKTTPGTASQTAMKSHFFKIMHAFLPKHTQIRNKLGSLRKTELSEFEKIVEEVEATVKDILENQGGYEKDIVIENEALEDWGGSYKDIPYWRCQPYFRTVNGIKSNGKRVGEEESAAREDKKQKKQAASEADETEATVEQVQ